MCPALHIEVSGPDRRARRLRLEGSQETVRATSAAVVRQLAVDEGDELEWDDLLARIDEVEYACARERGLQLLGYRERSEAELRRRLSHDGYPSSVVERVCVRLKELELVDDDRFAALWARQRLSSGYGATRIVRELEQKGISADAARAAVDEVAAESQPAERALRLLTGRRTATRQERERAIGRLVR
ncbi:MAG: regulatory protein RecX, partial [Actinobacteria bacterium]